MQHASTPSHDLAKTALLSMHAYALIARRTSEDDNREARQGEARQWKEIRRRLQLAEAGKWHLLLDELLKDVDAVEQAAEESRHVSVEEQHSMEGEERRKRGLAMRKVKLDCARTAAQLLKGQGMLPASEATAQAQMAQLVCSRTAEDQTDFDKALEEAWASGSECRTVVKERHVRRRLENLRIGAQPGGSLCRNDVIIVMGELKQGVRCLMQWAQCWAEGRIPPMLIGIMGAQVLRPLRKENGKPKDNVSYMGDQICIRVLFFCYFRSFRGGAQIISSQKKISDVAPAHYIQKVIDSTHKVNSTPSGNPIK